MLKVFLVDFITRFGENAIRICGRCAYSVHVQYRKALPWRGVLLGGVQSAIVAGCGALSHAFSPNLVIKSTRKPFNAERYHEY